VSRDDKGDLYLEPEKFISRIVSVVMLLKYIVQFLHHSSEGRRNPSFGYLIHSQRVIALIYVS